jgi:hypothetical protein
MIDTTFVSTRLSVPPSRIHTAIGKWHQSLPSITMARRYVRFGHRLWLATESQLASSDPLQLYAVRGILWMNGQPIRVDLEFSKWSATVSELALRPAHLAWPVRTERYACRARRSSRMSSDRSRIESHFTLHLVRSLEGPWHGQLR